MDNNSSEQELAVRSRRGDSKAQMELYDRYFPTIYRTAMRVLRNAEEAEEVAQESFLKFFTCKGDDPSCVEAVIRRIAINGSIDALRRHKIEFLPLTIDHPSSDELHDLHDTKIERLITEIDRLKDPYRTTLTLNLIEGLDYEEIATYLKVTTSTVRSHVSRAKAMIVQKITYR